MHVDSTHVGGIGRLAPRSEEADAARDLRLGQEGDRRRAFTISQSYYDSCSPEQDHFYFSVSTAASTAAGTTSAGSTSNACGDSIHVCTLSFHFQHWVGYGMDAFDAKADAFHFHVVLASFAIVLVGFAVIVNYYPDFK